MASSRVLGCLYCAHCNLPVGSGLCPDSAVRFVGSAAIRSTRDFAIARGYTRCGNDGSPARRGDEEFAGDADGSDAHRCDGAAPDRLTGAEARDTLG